MTDDEIDDMTVDSAIKTIKQLRNQLEDYKECFANLAKERDELWEDLERVTKERDEARRDACKLAVIAQGADDVEGVEDDDSNVFILDYMKSRGWDCFTEEYKQRKQALDRLAELDQELGL